METTLQVSDAMTTSPFWDGFAAYCEGQPLEDMPTDDHKRGWWSANSAQAGAELPPFASDVLYVDVDAELEDYREYVLDTEYHRMGGW